MGRSGAIPLGMQKPGTSFTPVFKEEGRIQKEGERRTEDGGRRTGRRKKEKPISILDYDTPSYFFFIDYDYYIHVHAPPPPHILIIQ